MRIPRMASSEDLPGLPGPEPGPTDIEIPVMILRRGITSVKSALPDPKYTKARAFYKSLQVFDASKPEWAAGDGNMFASDGTRGSYFYCDALKGKAFVLPVVHLPQIEKFLKKSRGSVHLRSDGGWDILINGDGQFFAWVREGQSHPKYSYYKEETLQFRVETKAVKRSLKDISKALRAIGDRSTDRLRLVYDAAQGRLQFSHESSTGPISGSVITVTPATDAARTQSFSTYVGIKEFLALIAALESKQVLLKVLVTPPGDKRTHETYHFRIFERFRVNSNGKVLPGPEGGFECRVTRFIPSRE